MSGMSLVRSQCDDATKFKGGDKVDVYFKSYAQLFFKGEVVKVHSDGTYMVHFRGSGTSLDTVEVSRLRISGSLHSSQL